MREKICLTCSKIIREVGPISPIKAEIEAFKAEIEVFKDIDMCKECNDCLNECPHIMAENVVFREIKWMSEKIKRLELFLDQMVKKRLLTQTRRDEMRNELRK